MISPQNLPPTRGTFSRVKVVTLGDTHWLFVSGIAASVDTPSDAASQTAKVFDAINGLLAEHNATFNNIVSISAFLSNMDDYDAYNEVRNKIFEEMDSPPASFTVEARLVKPEFLVEVAATAVMYLGD